MKVLHVITGLATGGAERALFNLLSGGLAAMHESAVLSLGGEGTWGPRLRSIDVPVACLHLRGPLPGPATLGRLRSVARDFGPDLIQGWMYHGNLAATVAGRMAPQRPAVAWNVRHSLYRLADEKFATRQVIRANRRLSAGTDAILYNSRRSREQHEAFGFAPARGRVIPNGFDTASLRPSPAIREDVRRSLGIPIDAPVVGHVARLHPMKDHSSFLVAASGVARRVPEVRFLLVGRNAHLDHPVLRGLVPSELTANFVCLGERPDVSELMQAMDLLCSSSWSEAFPNVVGEAMAVGVPCVVTDVGDSGDIVGSTGGVVPARDPVALTRALLELLAMTAADRQALGRQARARIERHYGLAEVVRQYAEVYEDAIPRRRS